jgi:signal transduction histidine kinase
MTASAPARPRSRPRPRDPLLRLYADVQGAADEQRRQLARRLHDTAQQNLAAASMSLALLERHAAGFSPAARSALSEAVQIVATCNKELRDISHALHPPLLEGLGLAAALRGLGKDLGPQRLALDIEELPRLPATRELTLFKLIDEAISCAFAGSGLVQVRVGPRGDVVVEGIPQEARVANAVIVRLRLRARTEEGEVRVRRAASRLRLDIRFPPTSAQK